MQIDVSAEVILSQLGYSKSNASLQQAEKMISVLTTLTSFQNTFSH